MPGISLLVSPNIDQNILASAESDMNHQEYFSSQVVYRDSNCFLMFTGYDCYPYWKYEDEETVILMEGLIYNISGDKIHSLLMKIARSFIDNGSADDCVKDFIEQSDGDFIIVIYNKINKSFLIYNDQFGRLNAYYYESSDTFIFSREIKFLLHFIPAIEFDRTGLAQFLVFEFTLGQKTLFHNIHRLPPSDMIALKSEIIPNDGMKVTSIHKDLVPLSFDFVPDDLSRSECIEKVSSLFLDGIKDRYETCRENGYKMIADISGGFDTRSVMMGLEKMNADVEYFTHRMVTGDESHIAQMLGDIYNKKISIIDAGHEIDYDEMGKLTYETDCTVSGWITLSCRQDMAQKKRKVKGKTAAFMGFHGERLCAFTLPTFRHKSIYSIFNANIARMSMKKEHAEILTDIPFAREMEAYFDSYGEKSIEGQIKHYLFEMARHHAEAGEDRTRRQFWTLVPFGSKFFNLYESKNIPLEYINYSFYTDFLRAIDPKGLKVPVYGKKMNLGSPLSVMKYDLKNRIRNTVKNEIMRHDLTRTAYYNLMRSRRNESECSKISGKILKVHDRLDVMKDFFRKENLNYFLLNEYSEFNLHRLLTVFLYFSELEKKFHSKIK